MNYRKCIYLGMIIAYLLVFCVSSVSAQEGKGSFKPYASIRMYTGYYQQSEELNGQDDDLDYRESLFVTSRFGGDFKVDEQLSGKVEVKLKTEGVAVRHAYATYRFGEVDFLFGHTWVPYLTGSEEISADDNGFYGNFGALDGVREDQLKFSFMGAYIALLKEDIKVDNAGNEKTTGVSVDNVDEMHPEIVIGYEMKREMFGVGFGVGYNSITIDDATNASDGERIDSMLGFIHANVTAGMISLLVNFGYGTNFDQFGIEADKLETYAVQKADGSIEDTTCMEGFVQLSAALTPVTLNAGWGYGEAKNSEWGTAKDKDAQWAAFVNVKIPITEQFFIQPEFSYRDYMKDKNDQDQGTEWYAGAKFQADLVGG